MTNGYTDNSGKIVSYHEQFKDTSKDLVIVSSDDIAFRVDSDVLKSSSSVFQSMFSTCDSGVVDNCLSIDHTSGTLAIYLTTLIAQPIDVTKVTWDSFKQALELCLLYDTPYLGNQILHQLQPINKFGHDKSHALFIVAARFNDILTAIRIISVSGTYYQSRYANSDRTADFWRSQGWPKELIIELPPDWIWAYVTAHMGCTGQPGLHQAYWDEIAMRFMKLLLP